MVGNLIHILLVIAILGAVLYVVWWAITQIPMPAPIMVVVRVIFALIVVVLALEILLPLVGAGTNCGRLIC